MRQILDYADILVMAPCYLGYFWAADKFCKKFLGASKGREWLFLFSAFCGWLLLDIVSRMYSVPYLYSVAGSFVLFIGLVLICFKAEREKKFLAAVMLLMAAKMTADFCDSFLACLVLFFRHTVKKIQEPFFNDWETGLLGGIGYCFAILSVCWMSKHLETVFVSKRKKWYVILAVPMLMLLVVFAITGWGASNGIMVRSGGSMGLYYDQMFSHAGICVLTGLSFFATGFYVYGMNRIYLEQEKSSRYHSQLAVYKMLAEQHSQSERLRHDMKNHIVALSGLYEGREWEKMGVYLKQLEENGLETGGDMTGSKAVDALLYQKQKLAERKDVRWECDIQIPKACGINEFDLCVLLGNILDNALEACARMQPDEYRFIRIQAGTVKKCFLIEAENSMDRTEKYRVGNSGKENPQEHGIGLLNIADVVKKYNGAVQTEAENDTFVISILIPLNDTAHDIKRAV